MKVSVIVPIYNAEKLLSRCLESLIRQTYTNVELLLIDDGSTDQSGLICDQFARQNDFVKVIHKRNGGVSSARNIGLLNATGDYTVFVDADDYVEPNYVEELVKLTSEEFEFSACSYCIVRKKRLFTGTGIVKVFTGEEAIINMLLSKDMDTSVCCKLLPTQLARDVLFKPDLVVAEDMYFYFEVLHRIKKVIFKDIKTYHYDLTDTGTINTVSDMKIQSLNFFVKLINNEDDNRIKLALKCKFVSTCFHFFVLCTSDQSNLAIKLKRMIRQYRHELLFGSYVSTKVRFACFLSYVSFDLVKWLMIFFQNMIKCDFKQQT